MSVGLGFFKCWFDNHCGFQPLSWEGSCTTLPKAWYQLVFFREFIFFFFWPLLFVPKMHSCFRLLKMIRVRTTLDRYPKTSCLWWSFYYSRVILLIYYTNSRCHNTVWNQTNTQLDLPRFMLLIEVASIMKHNWWIPFIEGKKTFW